MVVDVAGEELCAQQLARGGLSTVVASWVTAKDKEVARTALACCALLSQHDCCAADIGTTEFLGTMQNMARGKDVGSLRVVAQYLSAAGAHAVVRARILELNLDEQVWVLVKSQAGAYTRPLFGST